MINQQIVDATLQQIAKSRVVKVSMNIGDRRAGHDLFDLGRQRRRHWISNHGIHFVSRYKKVLPAAMRILAWNSARAETGRCAKRQSRNRAGARTFLSAAMPERAKAL